MTKLQQAERDLCPTKTMSVHLLAVACSGMLLLVTVLTCL